MLRIGGWLTKQVQCHTHSSLTPYARKEGELIYGTLKPLGGVLIFHSLVGRHKDTKMAPVATSSLPPRQVALRRTLLVIDGAKILRAPIEAELCCTQCRSVTSSRLHRP